MSKHHNDKRYELLNKLLPEVAGMRKAQRNYFKTRSREAMQESMQYESRVDSILNQIATVTSYAKAENPAQAGLFE